MKFTGRNTTESNVLQFVCVCQFQAGTIAGSKHFTVVRGQFSADNRSYRVQYISARQVVGRCYLCLSRRFGKALLLHYFGAFIAQLHTGKCMNGIVDTAVAGIVTARQLTVGSVDDGVDFQRRDIALPKTEFTVQRF